MTDKRIFCYTCTMLINESEPNWLLCTFCKNSYHMSCMKRQCTPGAIYGDVFFKYTCSECSSDHTEIFCREKMTWIQVIVLVLYHMQHKATRQGAKGFFHWRTHIVNFIDQKWSVLFPRDFKRRKNWTGTISGCLSLYSNTFVTSGIQHLREAGWWKLTFPELTPKLMVIIHSEMVSKKFQNKEDKDYENLIKLIKEYAPHICTVNTEVSSNIHFKTNTDYNTSSSVSELLSVNKIDVDLHHDVEISEAVQESFTEEDADEEAKFRDTKTLFSKSHRTNFMKFWQKNVRQVIPKVDNIVPLSPTEEMLLLKHGLTENNRSTNALKRKLIVRSLKRKHGIPLFNLDGIDTDENSSNKNRFSHYRKYSGGRVPQEIRIAGGKINLESFISPYTNRELKPFIRRDFDTEYPWLKLMAELQIRTNQSKNWKLPSRYPVDFSYVRPHHIASVNSLCERYFWPNIDLTEALEYPDFSIVAMYRRLVIGFAFMVPDVKFNETYISFIFTLPAWRKCGLATYMLYHLIQTCMGKDITLHVAIDNPAIFLYQKLGFKVEEVSFDFYESYIREDSKQSRHAFFMSHFEPDVKSAEDCFRLIVNGHIMRRLKTKLNQLYRISGNPVITKQ